ncbi:MAG: hypothetical protein IKV10_00915 [Alphaproteobacteria bacterium]|nr:hypothetical protein [Alphaproteobacteria bacterium]
MLCPLTTNTRSAFGRTATLMGWRENDNKTTPEQAAVFENTHLIFEKYEEQEQMKQAMASMTNKC